MLTPYKTVMLCGFLALFILMYLRRKRYNLTAGQAILFTFFVIVSGIAGTKVMFALESGGRWSGFSFFGAVFIVPLLMMLFGKLVQLKPLQSLDACAPCGALMVGVMRIGCLIEGCCGGWLCTIGNTTFRWPTQIMECIADLCILILLLRKEKKDPGSGQLYFLFMSAYGMMRFCIEFLRESKSHTLFHLAHLWAVISIVIGLSMYFYIKKKNSKPMKKAKRKKQ